MNKKLRIALDIILITVGVVLLVFGIKDAYNTLKKNTISDNVKFSRNFSYVPEDNIYKYVSLKEANKILKEDKAILLIGNKNDSWTQVLTAPFENIVKEYVDDIYYLELNNIDEDDKSYKSLLKEIDEPKVPEIYIIKDGKQILYLNKKDLIDSTYKDAPIEYYTDERIQELKQKLNKISDLK